MISRSVAAATGHPEDVVFLLQALGAEDAVANMNPGDMTAADAGAALRDLTAHGFGDQRIEARQADPTERRVPRG